MVDDKIPFSRAILWILLTTLLVSGSAFTGWLYFLHIRAKRFHDDQYRMVAIMQRTPKGDALKTAYLAELLHLSIDRPISFYQFDAEEAMCTLLSLPAIKRAEVKKIPPGTLFIDYDMRTPLAYIGDFANTVVDADGVLFPFRPFFTPKHLPTLYLGLEKEECRQEACLRDLPALTLAFAVLNQFASLSQENLALKQLDVSQAQADSYGQRQIVLVLEESDLEEAVFGGRLIYLRLNSEQYSQGLVHFSVLRRFLLKGQNDSGDSVTATSRPIVIDLRIPHLAFISPS